MKYRDYLLAGLTIVLVVMTGCQSTSNRFLGKTAEPEFIVPLPGRATDELWEAPDMVLHYDYRENGKTFEIDGELELAQHYRAIFDRLVRTDVYLLFLDSNSMVLNSVLLVRLLNDETADRYAFRGKITIPQNAVSFSFAYEGMVAESIGRKKNSINFWLHPK